MEAYTARKCLFLCLCSKIEHWPHLLNWYTYNDHHSLKRERLISQQKVELLLWHFKIQKTHQNRSKISYILISIAMHKSNKSLWPSQSLWFSLKKIKTHLKKRSKSSLLMHSFYWLNQNWEVLCTTF